MEHYDCSCTGLGSGAEKRFDDGTVRRAVGSTGSVRVGVGVSTACRFGANKRKCTCRLNEAGNGVRHHRNHAGDDELSKDTLLLHWDSFLRMG